MKKLLIVLLLLVMSGCTSNADEINEKENVTIDSSKSSESKNVNDDSEQQVIVEDVNFNEVIIIENEVLRITAKNISYEGFMGPEIKLLIENLSTEDITVQVEYMSINNIMIDPIFSADVMTGKKVNDSIIISSSDLDNYEIENISLIEFKLVVINSNSWDRIFESGLIELKTNVSDSYNQKIINEGYSLLDENGVKVIALGLGEDFMGQTLWLYIENNTEEIVTIQSEDTSVNGFMVYGIFSSDILPGKVSYDTITFMSSEMEENGIEEIEEIEFKLTGVYSTSWDRFLESDILKIIF